MADTAKNPCPLIAWELLKLKDELIEQMKCLQVGAIVLEIVKTMLVGPIANAIIDVLEEGVDLYDSVVNKLTDLINSVSPTSWIMYGMASTAKEINGAAQREKDMLNTIISLVRGLNTPFRSASSKYVRVSNRALKNIKAIGINLTKADSATTATQMYNYLKIAEILAESNENMLSDRISGYRNTSASLSSIVDGATDIYTYEGTLKRTSQMGSARLESAIIGLSARMRKDVLSLLTPLLKRYVILCRIVYMYSGINYLPQAKQLQDRLKKVISMLNLGELEGHTHIDEELTAISDDFKRSSQKMWNEIKGSMGLYNHSMSSKYDIRNKSDNMGISEGSEIESYLAASAFSSVPNEQLTLFGASAKLSTSISLFNTIVEEIPSQPGVLSSDEMSLRSVASEMAAVKRRLVSVNMQIDDSPDGAYKFEDGLGMAEARGQSILDRESIAGLTRGLRGSVQIEYNVEFSSANIKPLELQMSEPGMGIAIMIMLVLPYAINPFFNSETIKSAVIAEAKKRIDYLSMIISQTQPIMGYTNPACESVVSEIRACGFSALADAAKHGQIATGAVNVVAGIVGGQGVLYDLYQSCVNGSPIMRDSYRMVQNGLGRMKKAKEDAIAYAVDMALKPFGSGMALINTVQIAQAKVESTKQTIQQLTDALNNATA